ncbi:MAG: NifU family protein [Vampirovibrionales bacterium]|nr:NifU family protein [Vampirovibrionales bacterium]
MSSPATEDQNLSKHATIDAKKVEEVLEMLRPYLKADGGNVELVGITEEGIVQLRLQGACGTCPSSTYTLKMGIEEQMKQYIPEVVSVEQVF